MALVTALARIWRSTHWGLLKTSHDWIRRVFIPSEAIAACLLNFQPLIWRPLSFCHKAASEAVGLFLNWIANAFFSGLHRVL